jgi:hypothetical protein
VVVVVVVVAQVGHFYEFRRQTDKMLKHFTVAYKLCTGIGTGMQEGGGSERKSETESDGDTHTHTHTHTQRERERERER